MQHKSRKIQKSIEKSKHTKMKLSKDLILDHGRHTHTDVDISPSKSENTANFEVKKSGFMQYFFLQKLGFLTSMG